MFRALESLTLVWDDRDAGGCARPNFPQKAEKI